MHRCSHWPIGDPVAPWVIPAKGSGREPVDTPLLPHSKLALGYGSGGGTPWEFVFADDRSKDIGFFKLFLSSSPANFGCLVRRKTPFDQDAENRHAAEVDKEEREAAELRTALDNSAQTWGVKMATVIQIRK